MWNGAQFQWNDKGSANYFRKAEFLERFDVILPPKYAVKQNIQWYLEIKV